MMNIREARLARETLVDVATPDGALGCVAFLSTRNGAHGAQVTVGNRLNRDGWYPLAELNLPATSREVIARYL